MRTAKTLIRLGGPESLLDAQPHCWFCHVVAHIFTNFLPLDGDESAVDKKQRQLETLRKRALSSDIMRDLQKQYDDRPEEVVVR